MVVSARRAYLTELEATAGIDETLAHELAEVVDEQLAQAKYLLPDRAPVSQILKEVKITCDTPKKCRPQGNCSFTEPASQLPALEGEVAVTEFLLLLTVYQARALEEAARLGGLTVSQMVCNLIQGFLDRKGRPLCQRPCGDSASQARL